MVKASNVLSAYKKTYETGTGCVRVTINGTTEKKYDRAVIYDQDGKPLNSQTHGSAWYWGWSGTLTNKSMLVCSGSVTVALETDGSVTRSGINVKFEPQ